MTVKLHVPDHVIGVDRHNPQSNAAASDMKFIEIISSPAHYFSRLGQTRNFLHPGQASWPVREESLPDAGTHSVGAYIKVGLHQATSSHPPSSNHTSPPDFP